MNVNGFFLKFIFFASRRAGRRAGVYACMHVSAPAVEEKNIKNLYMVNARGLRCYFNYYYVGMLTRLHYYMLTLLHACTRARLQAILLQRFYVYEHKYIL
jgi:hypothetical protein